MNREEATEIDRRHKILPGGTGEHEFYLSDSYQQIEADLGNCIAHCGGYLSDLDAENAIVLSPRHANTYRIRFSPELDRVIAIDLKGRDRDIPYWCESRQRKVTGHYQSGNALLPLLVES